MYLGLPSLGGLILVCHSCFRWLEKLYIDTDISAMPGILILFLRVEHRYRYIMECQQTWNIQLVTEVMLLIWMRRSDLNILVYTIDLHFSFSHSTHQKIKVTHFSNFNSEPSICETHAFVGHISCSHSRTRKSHTTLTDLSVFSAAQWLLLVCRFETAWKWNRPLTSPALNAEK